MSTTHRRFSPAPSIASMPDAPFWREPELISAHCQISRPAESCAWHSHPFAELTLVADGACKIGLAGSQVHAEPNSLFLHHPGEHHGAWNGESQSPRFWVLHFTTNTYLTSMFHQLANRDPLSRVVRLTSDQSDAFKWMFLEIARERARRHDHHNLAESSWLRLLLLSIQRWAAGETMSPHGRVAVSPELHRLWQLVQSAADDPVRSLRQICLQPNYDSLRHGFRKAFGCSPREMIIRLKIRRAQDLLSETGLSIKEISSRCGYLRQHEFARAFHQRVGLAPSQWRLHPSAINISAKSSLGAPCALLRPYRSFKRSE